VYVVQSVSDGQVTASPTQLPDPLHSSVCVVSNPSSQEVPSAVGVIVQVSSPSAAYVAQVVFTGQLTTWPAQAPAVQTSVCVVSNVSSHTVPLGRSPSLGQSLSLPSQFSTASH
jgi:hypothetical protein